MSERKYNFNPGPAVLPVEVIEEAQANMLNFAGSGIGLLETSHRGKEFLKVMAEAEGDLRTILGMGDDYTILFTTGGATTQFSAVPLNLGQEGKAANYILSGHWAEKACEEAKRFTTVHVAASTKEVNYTRVPREISLSPNASYVHFTSNNTIFGTQLRGEPDAKGAPLICDASSDILSRRLDISRYSLIYAGAQKNLGPAGVTLVIMQKSLLERSGKNIPLMLDYNTYAKNDSLYNTPPVFAIYVVGLVLKWILKLGGLAAVEQRNKEKAELLYDAIDETSFYRGTAEKESRSWMNVTFRLADEKLEPVFIEEAKKAGFAGLAGHRSVGGMRASIYNAFPKSGVEALVSFMRDFAKRNG